MVTFGISTWSIHRALQSGKLNLLDVPAAVRDHGMVDLQICHFHLESRDADYLANLREVIIAAGTTLDALLIDFGDISHPENGARDSIEIENWLSVAKALGARYARISAGAQSPNDETLARSAAHLLRLADIGDRLGVRVITENWHALLPSSAQVNRLKTLTYNRVPLCLDFGNWVGPQKYEELEAIAVSTATVHAKCSFFADGEPDAIDFERCLQILKDTNYRGTITLIYDGISADEWRGIDTEFAIARRVLL